MMKEAQDGGKKRATMSGDARDREGGKLTYSNKLGTRALLPLGPSRTSEYYTFFGACTCWARTAASNSRKR